MARSGLNRSDCDLFRGELERSRLRGVIAHDSYLINLASADRQLSDRSVKSFTAELGRCQALGIPAVVSHPGNYITDRDRGLRRNAEGYARCLEAIPNVQVWIETTAGGGTALGATFEELAELRDRIPEGLRERVGFCADTCHLYAAGHDLVTDFDGVWTRWDRVIGLAQLRCFHLNDSKTPFGSRRDRHQLIGEGTLGPGTVPADHARPAVPRRHEDHRDTEGRATAWPPTAGCCGGCGPTGGGALTGAPRMWPRDCPSARLPVRRCALTPHLGVPIFCPCENQPY